MAIKKIYLLPSIRSQYGVLNHFVEELSLAFMRLGVDSRVLTIDRQNFNGFIEEIRRDPPDCTLSFNGLLPDENGIFLADILKIPHVAFVVDSPNNFISLLKSPWNIIASVDSHFCEVFREMGFSDVLYMPHAASSALRPLETPEPLYDILMLNSFLDHEIEREKWIKCYPAALVDVLDEAAALTIENRELPYLQAFLETMNRHRQSGKEIDPAAIDIPELLQSLEAYIGAKSRTMLLQSIDGVPVHLFGSTAGDTTWKKYLPHDTQVVTHPPLPFLEAIEHMKRAKIVINCTPEIKYGGHERIFNAMVNGAAVLALETPFMHENFHDEEDVLLFNLNEKDEMNRKIQRYLADDALREQLAKKGRQNVMKHHTWDQRAASFLKELPSIIERKSTEPC